ncbi:MAG: VRR-NUC domain-containing protein [Bacteroidales bacterium]|jgi:hypothetical protein|nr:VRR-NUC domain-containing protein [Bacteroidales bacterium]
MRHIEDNIQINCVTWFGYQYPDLALLLHHSPNGGKRNAREAARFKKLGTRAGFPDLILLFPSSGFHALLIEMKTEQKGSKQTDNQKAYQEAAGRYNYKYVVCRSLDDFRDTIKQYLAL